MDGRRRKERETAGNAEKKERADEEERTEE